MKNLLLLLFMLDSLIIFSQCLNNQLVYDFETDIIPWTSKGTYSFGHSFTSFESERSIFVKASFDDNNTETLAGSSSNFNNVMQDWNSFEGIEFDFKFVDVATDDSAIGRPPSRSNGNRLVYIELKDVSGNKSVHTFTDTDNAWHQRKVYWHQFRAVGVDIDFSKIISIGFFTERSGLAGPEYTEVFRFDDIELICECQEDLMVYDLEDNIVPWKSINTQSFGHSFTSFESTMSIFVKLILATGDDNFRAGAFSNFGNIVQNWSSKGGIKFDFKFPDISMPNEISPVPDQLRKISLELMDQSGNVASYLISYENIAWHQRSVNWDQFSNINSLNLSQIISIGFYSYAFNPFNTLYREEFRFDDIELICVTDPCIQDLVELNQPIINNDRLVQNTVVSNGTVIEGKNITYKAGLDLELVQGFQVQSGSRFAANVGDCDEPVPIVGNLLGLKFFNNSLTGEEGELPLSQFGLTFIGNANDDKSVVINGSDILTYERQGNINHVEGTIEGLISPSWDSGDGQTHALLSWGLGGGMLIEKDAGGYLKIIINRYGQSAGGNEVSVGTTISGFEFIPNQNSHFAVTWSSTSVKFYLNGILKAQGSPGYNLPAITSNTIFIGSDNGINVWNGAIDEIFISDYAKPQFEIEKYYNSVIGPD